MEKNVTSPQQGERKPNFLKVFLYVLAAYLAVVAVFRPKADDRSIKTIPPIAQREARRIPVPFETESLSGNFNAVGLRLDDVTLRKYRETMDEDSKNVELLRHAEDGTGAEKSSYLEFGLLGREEEAYLFPSSSTEWKVVSKTPSSISLSWSNGHGAKFVRSLEFDDKYMLKATQKVSNESKAALYFYPYARAVSAYDTRSGSAAAHTGFIGYLNGSLEEHTYADLVKKSREFTSGNGWLGFGSAYFMSVLIPEAAGGSFAAQAQALPYAGQGDVAHGWRQFQADYVRDAVEVEAGGSREIVFRIYIGAKEADVIAKYEKEFAIPKFDLSIDYGFFYILSKPFTQVLKFINGFVGNFGWAIVLFTILIRLLLFPIAQKSFKSMEKIKKLQPEMKRIQTIYAHDKQKMNMELAMLYKTRHVNPLSGCLPLLLQLPVLIALYKSLVISIEMRHAPWIMWVHDLSAADPTNIFNLFGILPYTPWSWLPHIGLLPVIMGLTMYVQQVMQPSAGMEASQAKMMKFLPLLFTFMLAGLPSGLVLYWTVNNVLSILQQRFVR
jgi:YidC/Oxa1 family membrane protein insertase